MYKSKYNILIVEDEFLNAEFVEQVLKNEGHSVVGNVDNANQALEIVKNRQVDFIFMDINLNGKIDGIMCAELLNKHQEIAIIYMTAYCDNSTLENASDTNVYGYLIKPFTMQDIKSTLMVAIKRAFGLKNINRIEKELTDINLGHNYSYNKATKTLTKSNIPIGLTHKEYEVLHFLCININQNISYNFLKNYVWANKEITNSTIRDTVLRLRRKVPTLDIHNIVGMGYCLVSV